MMATTLFVVFMAGLAGSPVRAEDVKAGDLVTLQAWSRATPNGAKIGAGYLTIENKGTAADKLVGVTGDVSPKIRAHSLPPLLPGFTPVPAAEVALAYLRTISTPITGRILKLHKTYG